MNLLYFLIRERFYENCYYVILSILGNRVDRIKFQQCATKLISSLKRLNQCIDTISVKVFIFKIVSKNSISDSPLAIASCVLKGRALL